MPIKIISTLCSFFLIGMLFTACHSHPKAENGDYAYTAAYTCPMKCAGSGSEEPGTCPACKMDYEKNEAHQHEHDAASEAEQPSQQEHKHDHATEAHDH